MKTKDLVEEKKYNNGSNILTFKGEDEDFFLFENESGKMETLTKKEVSKLVEFVEEPEVTLEDLEIEEEEKEEALAEAHEWHYRVYAFTKDEYEIIRNSLLLQKSIANHYKSDVIKEDLIFLDSLIEKVEEVIKSKN
jgi:hypothetical protein